MPSTCLSFRGDLARQRVIYKQPCMMESVRNFLQLGNTPNARTLESKGGSVTGGELAGGGGGVNLLIILKRKTMDNTNVCGHN